MDSGDPAALYDREVVDSAGDKVGTVQGVWVDDATNQLEFIGVQTSIWTRGVHVVPLAGMQEQEDTIQVSYAKDQIEDAPRFSHDVVLSPDDENRVYGYYGLTRSTSVSPTGLPAEPTASQTGGGSDTASRPSSTAVAEAGTDTGPQLRKLDRDNAPSTTTAPADTGGTSRTDPQSTATQSDVGNNVSGDSVSNTATGASDSSNT